uniref:ATP-binding protein n=1 Tax=Flavobacterium sp. TaxID=239 RepID=UPI00404B19F4
MPTIPIHIEHRTTYTERVAPFIGKNIIKVFTGQRRVGKSYLLFQIIEMVQKNYSGATIIYINKEDLQFSEIRNAKDLHDYVIDNQAKTGKTFVFIDEIQDIEHFEAALRSLLLNENLDLYCTGSNANLLSGDIAGHLSGRFVEITVYSLSYAEFLQFHALSDTDVSLELYMKYGGLPYLKHLPLNDEVVFDYLKNIYNTIVYRDIINRYAIRNTTFLEQLVHFLAAHTGSVFSAKKISDFLKSQRIKIAPNQVQVYVQHLVSAFLLHKVARYDLIGKRLFEIGDKYYFENLGIRNGIWGYRLEDRGKIMENMVYNHLVFRGYEVKVGTLGDKEIDFIAEKKGDKIYVQVALSIQDEKTIEREYGNLMQIADNYPKMVVCLDAFSGASYQGITSISLRNFLMTI